MVLHDGDRSDYVQCGFKHLTDFASLAGPPVQTNELAPLTSTFDISGFLHDNPLGLTISVVLALFLFAVAYRSIAAHAEAAYIASRVACAERATKLDVNFDRSLSLHGAVAGFNRKVKPSSQITVAQVVDVQNGSKFAQRTLSNDVDDAILDNLLCDRAPVQFRAHVRLLGQEGAGAWLKAIPNPVLSLSIDPSMFRILLRRRLRVPIFQIEHFCGWSI